MNRIIKEDIDEILSSEKEEFLKIAESNILITGATGLLGSMLTRVFIAANEKYGLSNRIILMVRDKKKARKMFGNEDNMKIVDFGFRDDDCGDINYIIHMASPTQSKYLKEKPVEVLDCIIGETRKMLGFALRQKEFKKFLYISSMEVYGVWRGVVNEDVVGMLDYRNTRTSYPLSKRAAEFYGFSYWKEYGLPVVNVRLAMCIAPNISKDDKRAANMFIRMAKSGNNITINTNGRTILNFIYITDALRGIAKLINESTDGDTYNLVSDDRKKTIFDLASEIAKTYCVRIDLNIKNDAKYAPENLLIMDNKKIKELGWRPRYDLKGSINRLKDFFEN